MLSDNDFFTLPSECDFHLFFFFKFQKTFFLETSYKPFHLFSCIRGYYGAFWVWFWVHLCNSLTNLVSCSWHQPNVLHWKTSKFQSWRNEPGLKFPTSRTFFFAHPKRLDGRLKNVIKSVNGSLFVFFFPQFEFNLEIQITVIMQTSAFLSSLSVGVRVHD